MTTRLNFAQPEIAQDISNKLSAFHDDFTKLSRDQNRIFHEMEKFYNQLPDSLRGTFGVLLRKQQLLNSQTSAVSGQLRVIDEKFEKHMPKRPVDNVGPDVGNHLEEEAAKARREEANRRFQQWAEKYKEEHKDEHKKKEPVF